MMEDGESSICLPLSLPLDSFVPSQQQFVGPVSLSGHCFVARLIASKPIRVRKRPLGISRQFRAKRPATNNAEPPTISSSSSSTTLLPCHSFSYPIIFPLTTSWSRCDSYHLSQPPDNCCVYAEPLRGEPQGTSNRKFFPIVQRIHAAYLIASMHPACA